MSILIGPNGLRPTPRQIAKQLFETFSVVDAHPLYKSWCSYFLIDEEESNQAFKAELEAKEFWDARKAKDAKPSSLSGTEFLALSLPKPEWIIDRVIPKAGLVAFSGKPGSYKSFFALWLAMRASAGLQLFDDLETDFFCKQKTVMTPTMFIEEENTQILTQDRYKKLKKVPSDNIHFRVEQQFKMQDPLWRMALIEDIQTKGIGLIIVDPFSSVMGLQNENDNAEVATVMDLIRTDFINKGITVVFIHHPSKGDTDGKNLRGAGDILGKCDVHLHFEKDPNEKDLISISYEKMRLIADRDVQNFKIRITEDQFKYIGLTKPKFIEERETLAALIRENMVMGEKYTKSVLAKDIGQKIENPKFKAAWDWLLQNDLIVMCSESKNGHPLFRLN